MQIYSEKMLFQITEDDFNIITGCLQRHIEAMVGDEVRRFSRQGGYMLIVRACLARN